MTIEYVSHQYTIRAALFFETRFDGPVLVTQDAIVFAGKARTGQLMGTVLGPAATVALAAAEALALNTISEGKVRFSDLPLEFQQHPSIQRINCQDVIIVPRTAVQKIWMNRFNAHIKTSARVYKIYAGLFGIKHKKVCAALERTGWLT